MKLVLHHIPQSRSFRVLWLVNELGLPVDVVTHAFGRNLHEPPFSDISPAGRVPALEIDGRAMFESGAILEFLCETHGGPLYRAPGSPERRDWLMWLHFSETIGQHLATLTQQHIALYPPELRSPVVMKIERRRLEKCLATVNTALNGKAYLLDSGFSAVDVAIGYSLDIAARFTPLDRFDALPDYLERLHARKAYQDSLPPQTDAPPIYKQAFYDLPED